MATRQTFTEEKRLRVYHNYGGKCAYCSKHLDVCFFTIDHVIPLAKGGTNEYANLALACLRCNQDKADGLELVVREVNSEVGRDTRPNKSYWFKGRKYYRHE